MRLFVGIPLAEPARSAVLELRERLVLAIAHQGVRFVRPEKLHLTLAFLGNVSDVEAVRASLREVQSRSFTLQVSGIGCFPNERRPKVVWTGIAGDVDALGQLASLVQQATSDLVEHREEHEYSPHLTLARINPGSPTVGRMLQPFLRETQSLGEWPVNEFVLYHSTPDGSYEQVETYALM